MPYRDHKGICSNGFCPEGANPLFLWKNPLQIAFLRITDRTMCLIRLSRAKRVLGEVDFHCFHLYQTTMQIVSLSVNWTERLGEVCCIKRHLSQNLTIFVFSLPFTMILRIQVHKTYCEILFPNFRLYFGETLHEKAKFQK